MASKESTELKLNSSSRLLNTCKLQTESTKIILITKPRTFTLQTKKLQNHSVLCFLEALLLVWKRSRLKKTNVRVQNQNKFYLCFLIFGIGITAYLSDF